MGEFRIGRKHASHSYPTPRFGAPSMLQVGGDQVLTNFAVVGGTATKVEKDATPTLLQVPLSGFRRANALWVELTGLVEEAEAGAVAITISPWFKFSTLPEFFVVDAAGVPVGAELNFNQAADEFQALTLHTSFLIRLPAQSNDVAPIALPAVDDLLVGLAAFGSIDFTVNVTSGLVAAEMNTDIVTQASTIGLLTLP